MRLTHLFSLSLLIALALACGPATSDQGGGAPETKTSTERDSGNYEIKVLNADLPSPRMEMSGFFGDSIKVTVNYGSPSVRGREVWGGLEAWNEVWRMGANECTAVSFSKDVVVGDTILEANQRYGMFTIPREKEDWTVIFNANADQWGAYEYSDSLDVARLDIKPQWLKENTEHLEFHLEKDANGDYIVMYWEKVALPVKITPKK